MKPARRALALAGLLALLLGLAQTAPGTEGLLRPAAAVAYQAEGSAAIGPSRTRAERLEPVPLDEWEFQGGRVTVGDWQAPASAFAGVRSTSADGITAELVYVGSGAESDYAGTLARDKIVLIDKCAASCAFAIQAAEATRRGAVGIVFIDRRPGHPYCCAWTGEGTSAFDGYYDWPPVVCVSPGNGAVLQAMLTDGPVRATLTTGPGAPAVPDGGVSYCMA